MKFKKIFLITFLLLAVLTISSVSANDTLTDEGVLQSASSEQLELSDDDISSEDEIISATDDGTFTTLQNKINDAEEGSTITLENDYAYNKGFKTTGIEISKPLTIDGNGHAIDAKGSSRIFNCIDNKIILKNINFYNASYMFEGGAIHSEANLEINNCNFINNRVYYDGTSHTGSDRISGGAIYSTNNLIVSDCKFNSNSADMNSFGAYGGAISNKGDGKITNCTFNNNDAGYGYWNDGSGGAIYNNGNLNIYKSKFTNNYASEGSAIYNSGTLNVYDETYDSAILNVYDSTFSDTKSKSIATRFGTTKISNCKFKAEPTKLTPKLTAPTKTFKLKTKIKKYVATLKTNKNKAMKNAKITLKVKGKTFSAKTNAKGQATFKITNLKKKGTFKATVTYNGNANYKKVTKTAKIIVKK